MEPLYILCSENGNGYIVCNDHSILKMDQEALKSFGIL